MSSHDMSIRTNLKVKPGITLLQIWEVLQEFGDEFRSKLDGELKDGDFEIPFEDRDNVVSLEGNGHLFLYLCFYGSSGVAPEWIDDLCKKLDQIVSPGGATVEIIDHDTSASNEEALCYRFIGADDHERLRARSTLGLDQARETLVGAIGLAGFAQVENLVKLLTEQSVSSSSGKVTFTVRDLTATHPDDYPAQEYDVIATSPNGTIRHSDGTFATKAEAQAFADECTASCVDLEQWTVVPTRKTVAERVLAQPNS